MPYGRIITAVALIAFALGAVLWPCSDFLPDWPESEYCSSIYNYQTLITGCAALVAALLTVLPVVGQYQMSVLQAAVMSRDVLIDRLKDTKKKREESRDISNRVTTKFDEDVYGGDYEGEPSISIEWAFHAAQEALSVVVLYESSQKGGFDPIEVNSERKKLIKATEDLHSALDDIGVLGPAPWEDPELGLTPEEIDKERNRAEAKAGRAKAIVPRLISAVSQAAANVDDAYEAVEAKLLLRLQKVDDRVLNMTG